MSENVTSNIPENQITIIPSLLIKITKILFWVTVFLYIAHILISYYLDWEYPGRDSNTLQSYMDLLSIVRAPFGYLTLGLLLIIIIYSFRANIRVSKVRFGVILIVIFYTIFGYQGKYLDKNIRYPTDVSDCRYCGRPFWSRGFFFKRRKEAKMIKTNTWNIIK